MDSCDDTPKGWVAPFGHPRINACSRLPVAFRSVPRPSSPPGAKASTECPSLARDRNTPFDVPSTMHRNHPQRRRPERSPTARRPCSSQKSLLLSTQQSPLNDATAIAGGRPKDSTSGQTMRAARPETHQNLIHPDKDLSPGLTRGPAPPSGDTSGIAIPKGIINADYFRFSAILTRQPHTQSPRPEIVVEVIGLEPTTPCLQSRCSPS